MSTIAESPADLNVSDSVADIWRRFFLRWPPGLAPSGVLVTSLNEQIPFAGFLVHRDLLLVERRVPDTLGSRKIIIPFGLIHSVKITDVVKDKLFRDAGFDPPAPRSPAKDAP
jgi:hypothetical protein